MMSSRRTREHRTPVAIKARVKSEIGWGDSQICNVSSRGMMVRHIPPPPLGSYVEVCRGPFSIVGRVRWIAGDRFGLQAMEEIDFAELQNPQRARTPTVSDRRRRPRPAIPPAVQATDLVSRLESSQRIARRLQFVVVLLGGATIALFAAQLAAAAFLSPISRANSVLNTAR
jgi:hypothetical protein